jgi:hypothetical protein
VVSFTLLTLYRWGKNPPVFIGEDAGWAPEPVWYDVEKRKFLTLPELEHRPLGRPVKLQNSFGYFSGLTTFHGKQLSTLNYYIIRELVK